MVKMFLNVMGILTMIYWISQHRNIFLKVVLNGLWCLKTYFLLLLSGCIFNLCINVNSYSVVIFRNVNGCCVGYFWNVLVDKCEGRLSKFEFQKGEEVCFIIFKQVTRSFIKIVLFSMFRMCPGFHKSKLHIAVFFSFLWS